MVTKIFPSTPQVSKKNQTNPTWRPPLSPSEKNIVNHNLVTHSTSRKTQIRDISSRYNNFSSSSSLSSSCSLPKQLQSSANRTHKQTTSDTTTRSLSVSFQGKSFSFQTKKQESVSQSTIKKHKNPSKAHDSNLPSNSMECSIQKKIVIHDDLHLASDTDSSSSGSRESSYTKLRGPVSNRGIKTPKKNLEFMNHNTQLLSPRIGSCIRVLDDSMVKGRIGNMNSIINYGKIKKSESRIEETHLMRLFYNRYLQWRCVNAKAELANLTLKKYAQINIPDVKNAIGSAVNVMQAIDASAYSLLSQMQRTNILVSELAKTVAHEFVLLEQSKDLLSTIVLMQVKQCSLRAQIIQYN